MAAANIRTPWTRRRAATWFWCRTALITLAAGQVAYTDQPGADCKVLELRAVSTNPADTVIEGAADPDGINGSGPAAVRAVRLTGYQSKISNFTIRNGHANQWRYNL